MRAGADDKSGRLAIIAGGGMLPHYLASAARKNGENPLIVQLSDENGPVWQGFDVEYASVGNFAGIGRLFATHGVSRVVLSGSVRRRPAALQPRPSIQSGRLPLAS